MSTDKHTEGLGPYPYDEFDYDEFDFCPKTGGVCTNDPMDHCMDYGCVKQAEMSKQESKRTEAKEIGHNVPDRALASIEGTLEREPELNKYQLTDQICSDLQVAGFTIAKARGTGPDISVELVATGEEAVSKFNEIVDRVAPGTRGTGT